MKGNKNKLKQNYNMFLGHKSNKAITNLYFKIIFAYQYINVKNLHNFY